MSTAEAKRRYHREWKRRWRKNPKNREKERKQWRDWYAKRKSSKFLKKRNAAMKRWRSVPSNKVKERKANLKRQKERGFSYAEAIRRKYGLSTDELASLKKRQKYRCKLCQKRKKLNVDHCHKTGRVRGLLCVSCNLMLGIYEKFTNDRAYLRRVLNYLR